MTPQQQLNLSVPTYYLQNTFFHTHTSVGPVNFLLILRGKKIFLIVFRLSPPPESEKNYGKMRFFGRFCFDMTRVIKIVLFTIRLQDEHTSTSHNINYADTLSSFFLFRSFVRFKSLLRAYADKMLEKTIFVTLSMGFVCNILLHHVLFRLLSCPLTHSHT